MKFVEKNLPWNRYLSIIVSSSQWRKYLYNGFNNIKLYIVDYILLHIPIWYDNDYYRMKKLESSLTMCRYRLKRDYLFFYHRAPLSRQTSNGTSYVSPWFDDGPIFSIYYLYENKCKNLYNIQYKTIFTVL